MTGHLRNLVRDNLGASMIEFSLVIGLFLTLTMGVVEFSFAFFQWNQATKAVNLGARLAAVSHPVSSDLASMTGLGGGDIGEPMPSFIRVCSGKVGECTNGGNYSSAAMDVLVQGRDLTCQHVESEGLPGMCDIFPRIQAQNVIVTYTQTGMGFIGRPGGPVPTITIEITGLAFNFVFLNALLGFQPIQIPRLHTTITGEDLSHVTF